MIVAEVMRRFPLTVGSDEDLGMVRSMMAWAEVRHLPVVDGGALVGIVSARELAAHPGPGTVASIMTRPVQTAHPDDSLVEVAGRMAGAKIGSLPVIEQGKLVGMVTTTDILTAQLMEAMGPTDEGPIVAEYMSDHPITVRPDDYVLVALDRMREHAVRHLPVVDGANRVVGMLSDRDLRVAVGDPLRSSSSDATMRLETTRVEDIMWKPVGWVRPTDRCAVVARKFAAERLSAVPVVEADGRLAGVLSYVDLLSALGRRE